MEHGRPWTTMVNHKLLWSYDHNLQCFAKWHHGQWPWLKEATISMKTLLVSAWGQEKRTGTKSMHRKKRYLIAVHSFPVATVPTRFRLGQLHQFWKPERTTSFVCPEKTQVPFMKSPKSLVLRSHCRFHCSNLSPGVIRHYLSLVSGRKLPGQHGRHAQTLLKHFLMTLHTWHSTLSTWHALNAGLLACIARAVGAQGWMMSDVKSSRMVLWRLTKSPHTGNLAPTCKTSSVPGKWYMEISKAMAPRCPGCFCLGLGARREHESLGAILHCARRP